MPDGDADEEEGPAPDRCEEKKDQPIAAVHLRANHGRFVACLWLRRFRPLALKRSWIFGFHGSMKLWKGPRRANKCRSRDYKLDLSVAQELVDACLGPVRSSTRLTITAQASAGPPSLPGRAPGTTTE